MRAPTVTFGPFAFDPNSRILRRDGAELVLPPRVIGVLEALLHRAGDVVPRQELIDSVWKDAFVTDTSLAEAVSVLRQALGDDPQAPSYIQTFHRRGYRFVAPVGAAPETGTLNFSGPGAAEKLSVPVSPSIPGQLLPWTVAAICAVLAAVAVRVAVTDPETVPPPVTRFTLAPTPGTRFDARAPSLAMSPDAARAVWSACDGSGCRLYVRAVDRLDAAPIAGTEDAAAPFFSPDGRWIGFFADGHLKKVSVAGGAPLTLGDAADPLGATWTVDNQIIYAGAAPGLRMIRDAGGEPVGLTTPRPADGEVRHAWPAHHPSANWLLFTITGAPEADAGGRLGILQLNARGSSWTTLIAGVGMAGAISADALVFSRGSEIQAVGFDTRRGVLTGAPQTVMSHVAVSRGAGQFAAATAGALLTLRAAVGADRSPLFWWTPSATGEPARVRDLETVSLSPDGRRVVGVDRADAARSDVWIADLERGTASRLTHGGVNAVPVWSPDGASVFFAASAGGVFAIHRRDADALRPAQRLYGAAGHAFPSAVSPDGTLLAFIARDAVTGADVWGLPVQGGAIQPLVRTAFDDTAAVFSPDGLLIAYQSNDAGRWEVYVHRRTDQRRVTVSSDGGTHPFWSADGRWLFFHSRGRLMRSAVSGSGSNVSSPEVVTRFTDAVPVAVDGAGRLLFQRRSSMPGEVAVLALQWVRELRQLLGPPATAMPR